MLNVIVIRRNSHERKRIEGFIRVRLADGQNCMDGGRLLESLLVFVFTLSISLIH